MLYFEYSISYLTVEYQEMFRLFKNRVLLSDYSILCIETPFKLGFCFTVMFNAWIRLVIK